MTAADLKDESDITWLEDPSKYSYVRQSLSIRARRTARPPAGDYERLIGYSTPW